MRLWSIYLLALTICAGCASPDPSSAPAEEVREFVYYNGPRPRTVDPALLTDSYGSFLALNLFEGLTVWDASAQTVLPGVAESWEISDDRRTYNFHLREEARWSDGTQVVADDFIRSWNRVLNPGTQAGFATLFYPIAGARELHLGLTTDAATLGVSAPDPQTLIVRLQAPVPYFLALTADAVMLPVQSECLKKYGWSWTDPRSMVVNGPYRLVEQHEDRYVMQRNARYWNVASVEIERIVALSEPPATGLVESFRAGDLHWTGFGGDALEAQQMMAAEAQPGFRSHPSLVTGYLRFNLSAQPVDDVRVRQALGHAIDRESVAAFGHRAPTEHLVPDGLAGYRSAAGLQHDCELARQLLTDAGYPGGAGLPAIEIAVDDQQANVDAMEEVARQWRRELGVEVLVYRREWRIHASTVEAGDFQVARGAWAADYPDPSNFMEIFLSTSPLNSGNYADPIFDDFVYEAQLTTDSDTNTRLLAKAEKRLLEQAAIVPLYNTASACLLSSDVQGYKDNVLNLHLLKYLSF